MALSVKHAKRSCSLSSPRCMMFHTVTDYGEKYDEVQQTSIEKTITKSAGPLSSDGYTAATATLLFVCSLQEVSRITLATTRLQ